MKKIAITGANGVIGIALFREISNSTSHIVLTPVDLPAHDIREYENVREVLHGHDAIVHLAWNTRIDNAGTGIIDPDNSRMFANVYRAALELHIPRVIMASSVHAHTIVTDRPHPPLSPYDSSAPHNPYGAHKLFMESLGRYYAAQGLEVVCVRFGGVTSDDKPYKDEKEKPLWLSHRDLGTLMTACIEKEMPEKFCILWGTSRSAIPAYDLSNPFGWEPQDSL